jgi:hypothetical protein
MQKKNNSLIEAKYKYRQVVKNMRSLSPIEQNSAQQEQLVATVVIDTFKEWYFESFDEILETVIIAALPHQNISSELREFLACLIETDIELSTLINHYILPK